MIKQILLFSIASIPVITSRAQIDKSDILLGGTFGFGTTNYTGYSSSSNSNFNPDMGYAIGKNSVLRLRLGYYYGKSEDASGNSNSKNNGFNTSIAWQNYFSIKDNLGWYTDLYGGFGKGSTKEQNTPGGQYFKFTSTVYSAGVSPGIYFMPTSGLLLSPNLGGLSYSSSKTKTIGHQPGKFSSFSDNLLNYFGFGIDYIIKKKKD